jgi:hypothetical protein
MRYQRLPGGEIMAARFQLTMRSGPTPGQVFLLEKPEMFLGRDLSVDIVINDAEVSRKHARLVFQGTGYYLEDLGSTNGTVVDGQRLMAPQILRGGEAITIGEHVDLVYEETQFDPDATLISYRAQSNQPAPVPISPQPVSPQMQPGAMPSPMPHVYAGQVPAGPVEELPPVQRRRIPVWAIILAVSLLLVICACGGVLLYIDANSLWCTVMPFLAGCP